MATELKSAEWTEIETHALSSGGKPAQATDPHRPSERRGPRPKDPGPPPLPWEAAGGGVMALLTPTLKCFHLDPGRHPAPSPQHG